MEILVCGIFLLLVVASGMWGRKKMKRLVPDISNQIDSLFSDVEKRYDLMHKKVTAMERQLSVAESRLQGELADVLMSVQEMDRKYDVIRGMKKV